MVDFYIDEVYPKRESYAFIAYFQNGYPADNFADEDCEVLEQKDTGKKCIATEINNILYTGEECDEPLGKTLVLARNRKTNKVRLIEVGNIELQPMLSNKVEATELETSYVDLGRKFGSKRHKKMLEQNEKLKINEEVVTEQLKNVSQNVSLQQLDLSSYNKTDSDDFYIPPINREAESLEDVYSLSSILTPEQFETIFNEIDSTDYRSNLCPYICDIYSDKWSKEQVVLAVYASTLLVINRKPMIEIKPKKFVACPQSATLDALILKEFFTQNNNGRLRPAPYKDKAICHIIVFLFLINNYKIDIQALCSVSKIGERSLHLKIMMTGGWIVHRADQGNKKIAVLKLPLNKASSNLKRKSAKF